MSEQEREHIEELVGKYILGEANEAEANLVEKWCLEDPENKKYLEDTQLIYERAQLPSEVNFDAEKAWTSISTQLTEEKKNPFIGLWKVAAAVILLATVSYVLYFNLAPGDEFVFVTENEVSSQTLPDQTEISLNRESEVKVEYNPRKKKGRIQLKGEATISIGKVEEIQWTVEAEDLLIRDIGTVFHVKAYPDSEQIEVSVLEGAVQFYKASEEGVLIQAGEKGVYDKISRQYSKVSADTNVISYKTRSFQFTEENLQSVVDLISEVYDQKIRLEGPIASCKITVDFENEEFETILTILSETMGLEISQENGEYVLNGKGCF